MPYRIDLSRPPAETLQRLIDLGALDVDAVDGGIAAIMPDDVAVSVVADAIATGDLRIAEARGRDDQSVWLVQPRPVGVGRLRFIPASWPAEPGSLRMVDGAAFGTGLHPTTALCLEALIDDVDTWRPAAVLDVGTGSGVLALAAVHAGVPRALAIDVSGDAVQTAAVNARLNGLSSTLHIVQGGPEALSGAWPLVLANVLAAPLIEMAPTLVRRVAGGGRLVLSGVRVSLAQEVERSYRRLGLRTLRAHTRDGWTVLILRASW